MKKFWRNRKSGTFALSLDKGFRCFQARIKGPGNSGSGGIKTQGLRRNSQS